MVELEVDCFVVLPSAMYERLGRIQNGGIIVLWSAAMDGRANDLFGGGGGADDASWAVRLPPPSKRY